MSQPAERALISRYLAGYPVALQEQMQSLVGDGGSALASLLLRKYPKKHDIRSDRALYDYVSSIKSRYLRSAQPLHKAVFDNGIHTARNALGLHISTSRVQGNKLSAKREIRIASLFRQVPEDLLRMIVVHELAHSRESDHNKAFYQLCVHMEPRYHQLEFDTRVYLIYNELYGNGVWTPIAINREAASA